MPNPNQWRCAIVYSGCDQTGGATLQVRAARFRITNNQTLLLYGKLVFFTTVIGFEVFIGF